MSAPSPLDLVRYGNEDLVAISIPVDGQILLVSRDWPAEFNELDEHERPSPIVAAAADVEVLATARSRFEAFNEKLIAAGDDADGSEAWDWSEVNALLEAAAEILPRYFYEFATDKGDWNGREVLSDDMVDLATPAALFIATHVRGYGEADVSVLSEALDKARSLRGSAPKP